MLSINVYRFEDLRCFCFFGVFLPLACFLLLKSCFISSADSNGLALLQHQAGAGDKCFLRSNHTEEQGHTFNTKEKLCFLPFWGSRFSNLADHITSSTKGFLFFMKHIPDWLISCWLGWSGALTVCDALLSNIFCDLFICQILFLTENQLRLKWN